MNPKVQARLAAIRARADAATPPPWSSAMQAVSGCSSHRPVEPVKCHPLVMSSHPATYEDAVFASNARVDVPALLDLLEALLTERDARATRYFESVKETHAADRALAKFGEEQA